MSDFRIAEHDLYEFNKGFLYRYNDQVSKLTVCARVRKPGYELAEGCREFTRKGDAGNDEKLPENIRRAKSKVFELALCNEFSYFCTLTFSQDKVKDRYDLEGCIHEKSELLHDRKCVRIFYLHPRHYILIIKPRGFNRPLGIFCFIHTLEAPVFSP